MSARPHPSDDDAGSFAGGIFAALPDLLLAGAFVYTWVRPTAIDPLMVKRLTAVTILEFIVMHSAPFSGLVALSGMARWRKALALGGLGAFYLLFAWGFSVAFDSMWPAYSFVGLMLNRLLGVLVGAVPRGAQATYLASCWIVGGITYLFGIVAVVTAPVPRLGVTAEVVRAQQFTSSGVFPEEPWRALAFGAIYFAVVGAWEVAGRHLIIRRARNRQ